jgi:secreted PhoX family phosphatase
MAEAPAFDPYNQTAEKQLMQFGYNNDYVGFSEIEPGRGMLCVNHEYTNEEVMFPGLGRQDRADFVGMTKELVDIEMAAHGGTVVEIAKGAEGWDVLLDSPRNRRITPLNTSMTFSGPAAGHDRLKTNADPDGMTVIGTINNCAGGMTPWGTYLMAEENFHGYFWTDKLDADGRPDVSEQPEAASMRRYGVPGRWYAWGKYYDRFNIDKEPNEVNKFGYIVEVDPMDPTSTPIKHTALGRFRHEGAETTVASDGKLVIYSGDDNRFDYQYKWVSAEAVTSENAVFGSSLLSEGTLYVARFNDDGTIDWLPLVHGEGPLTAENGFNSQADIAIDTRLAADLLGATPMDRPEDAQPRGDGTAYIMLTNNSRRSDEQVDAANPRAENLFGHIVEIKEEGGNHSATRGTWSILVKCGDPELADVGAQWNPETSANGWFAAPDNCAIDSEGRLWISTDQGSGWGRTGKSDGLYSLETEGELRGHSKLFFRCPVGGELCGPYFADDSEALFLAVQHPGTDGTTALAGFERNSTFEDPATRWPDFQPGIPPRPSVLLVTKQGGGKIAV